MSAYPKTVIIYNEMLLVLTSIMYNHTAELWLQWTN